MFKLIGLLILFAPVDASAILRMGPSGFVKTHALAGTPERLSSTTLFAGDLLIRAPVSNTGNIIIGAANVLFATGNGVVLAAGESVSFENLFPVTNAEFYDLMEFWMDTDINGDKATIITVTGFQ